MLSCDLDGDGLPVEVIAETGGRFFQHHAVVSVYRMLLLLLQPQDEKILSMALETPYLRDARAGARVSEAYTIQFEPQAGSPIVSWLRSKHPTLCTQLDKLRIATRTDTAPEVLARLYRLFDIRAYYAARGDLRAVENLEKLREQARGLFPNEQALTLPTFVNWLRVSIKSGRGEDGAEVDPSAEKLIRSIRVMTVHKAKGLEFPLVIIPEMQERLSRSGGGTTILLNREGANAGLDVDLDERWRDGIETVSTSFAGEQAARAAELLEEELRILYVAETRAQQGVIFVGSDPPWRPKEPGNSWYSWQDELIRAQPFLTPLRVPYLGLPR